LELPTKTMDPKQPDQTSSVVKTWRGVASDHERGCNRE
jgi:hypothetical protein